MTTKKFNIYINKNSGYVLEKGENNLRKKLSNGDYPIENIYILNIEEIFQHLKNADKAHPILIGGGDGTVCGCANILMNTDVPFGILPLGTMNLMARDLNIPLQSIKKSLSAYSSGFHEQKIDVGKANDKIFLCGATLGVMPKSVNVREKMRQDPKPVMLTNLFYYVLQEFDFSKAVTYDLKINERMLHHKTTSLIISNNIYNPQDNELLISNRPFYRPVLNGGKLGIYSAMPKTFFEKLRILLRFGIGGWRKDPTIKEWECDTLTIKSAKSTELISLDAELFELETPIKFRIEPKALALLVPDKVK